MAAKKATPKSKDETKEPVLRVRLSQEEQAAFQKAADKLHVNLSSFVRMTLVEKAKALGVEI
jgi:uncharacterized protein (DUF1778 family)